ncbi:(R)-mandelonitrile lyase [Alicyclobacillus sendaiensis]|uniref:(R)-mandelonitrile lyase n=1 Tax=Alicyclobacillus sendaiensis TaxID=192387 RepID=UPI0007846743|nr:cupin domain-containing protein [Alicyclobacillus sendaiensis]
MKIVRNRDRKPYAGPEATFTGRVSVTPAFNAEAPARVGAAVVRFEPGARTAWHTHPLGQMLIILEGVGWVQREGEPVQEVYPGDVVWFEPGERHWHGASPEHAMSHVAIQEALDGSPVQWLEHVTDEEYRRGS